jgi:hypothetical protein
MPFVVTDVQFAFAAGALLADAGAPVLQAARTESAAKLDAVYRRYMLRSLIYSSFFLGPVATILMLAYPAWETQYISPIFDQLAGNLLYAAPYAVFLSALFAAGWFGNWLGFRWVLNGKRIPLRILYGSVVAITVAIVFGWRYPAPVRIGSYADFQTAPDRLMFLTDDQAFFTTFAILTLIASLPLVIAFIQVRLSVSKLKRSAKAEVSTAKV